MWQAGDVGTVAGGVNYRQALAGVTASVLVMPCETDQYFAAKDGQNEVEHMHHGIYRPIPSIWGHMAGAGVDPVDLKWLNERISEFLTGE
jgi:homoserine O-acetyltransferase